MLLAIAAFLIAGLLDMASSSTPASTKRFGRYGSVRVDYPAFGTSTISSDKSVAFSTSWPDAIRMNTTAPSIRNKRNGLRTYKWSSKELQITCNMTALDNPTCTRLVPPLSWLSASGSKVKVFYQEDDEDSRAGAALLEKQKFSEQRALMSEEDAVRLFHEIDIDKNGYIDSYELYRALSGVGVVVTTDDIRNMMADADTSGDDRIDIAEWKTLALKINALRKGSAGAVEEEGLSAQTVHHEDASDVSAQKSVSDDLCGGSREKFVTISVNRERAEKSLSTLRKFGFKRADIYRMLYKGPWVLAFDVSKTLPRISDDLESMLGLSKEDALHVVSHCPYLIAQYARYKGRDLYTTARALIEVGYSSKNLAEDIRRFPSMLSAPPDRLRGWMALLEGYGVRTEKGLFGKTLKKAPFMFYVNPPYLLFQDDDTSIRENYINDVSTTASEFVVFDAFRVLQLLSSYDLDMDKVVRSQPGLLLVAPDEVNQRAHFLLNLFLERRHQRPIVTLQKFSTINAYKVPELSELSSLANNFDKKIFSEEECSVEHDSLDASSLTQLAQAREVHEARKEAYEQLNKLVQSNPKVLSISSQQMKNAANALLRSGMRYKDVLLVAKRHPRVLTLEPQQLRDVMNVFKVRCFLRKSDLKPFILRLPGLLSMDAASLAEKVEYLYSNLEGNVSLLRKWPAYLTYDLDSEIRPAAEFVRACGKPPLFKGLPFLLTQTSSELSVSVGMKPEVYAGFKEKFMSMWAASEAEKKELEAEVAATNKKWETIMSQTNLHPAAALRNQTWAREEMGNFDLDDLFEEAEIYFD